jgi:hypothetical protein
VSLQRHLITRHLKLWLGPSRSHAKQFIWIFVSLHYWVSHCLTPPVLYCVLELQVLAAQSACLGETLLTYRGRVSCLEILACRCKQTVSQLSRHRAGSTARKNTVGVRVQLTPIHNTMLIFFQIKAEQDRSGFSQLFHALTSHHS